MDFESMSMIELFHLKKQLKKKSTIEKELNTQCCLLK